MNRKTLILGLIGSFIISFYGCATTSYSKDSAAKTSGLLEPSGSLRFNDVPVPAGFKLIPDKSY